METLYKLFYIDQNKFKSEYERRFKDTNSVHLGINIGKYEAFYYNNSEIYELLLSINKKNNELNQIINSLPKLAISNYITKSLIDEIRMSNEIEKIFSTRKDISNILIDLKKNNKKNRFYGLVNKYNSLMSLDEKYILKDSNDIRKLYDDIFLSEIKDSDIDLILDGKIFRKNSVYVMSLSKNIHNGVMPEEKIIEYIDKSLDFLNNYENDELVKLAAFHYLFGYIHPFYDGNGRINRLISSYYLKSFNPILAFRISYTIKENIKDYYKSFEIINHPNNRGDLTPFILTFLNIINVSIDNTIEDLKIKLLKYNFYFKIIKQMKYNKKIMKLLEILLNATLFTNLGIYKKDLIKELNVSPNTLTNYLEMIDSEIIISDHDGNKTYYLLNLTYFDNRI